MTLGATRLLIEDPADAHIRAIEKEPDEPAPAPASFPDEPLTNSEEAPAPARGAASNRHDPKRPAPPRTPPRRPKPPRAAPSPRRLGPDAIIFLLAGAILLASVVALFVLLRS